jgi:hypothetical protein
MRHAGTQAGTHAIFDFSGGSVLLLLPASGQRAKLLRAAYVRCALRGSSAVVWCASHGASLYCIFPTAVAAS